MLRKANLQSQKSNFSQSNITVATELARVNARLAAADTIIATLPEGPERKKEETNKSKLVWRAKALNDRKDNVGAFAILEVEVRIDEIDARIAAIDDALVKIEARKSEIV